MASVAIQGSLSCKAVLGLIITKATYLLKDTEKIGLYLQLSKEALAALCQIYRVENNCEFTEFLHLVLFGYDSVSFICFEERSAVHS